METKAFCTTTQNRVVFDCWIDVCADVSTFRKKRKADSIVSTVSLCVYLLWGLFCLLSFFPVTKRNVHAENDVCTSIVDGDII